MKGTMRACGLLLCLAALAAGQRLERDLEEEDDVGYEEEWRPRMRRQAPDLEEDYPGPRYERDDGRGRRSCCREYEEEEPSRVRRATRRHQYEVYEETGEEPQGTAPLYGPPEELLGAHSEQYSRVATEPGAPAPAHYLRPAPSADQLPEGTFHRPQHHTQHRAGGGGDAHRGRHYAEGESESDNGYKSVEHQSKGAKGHKTKDLHTKEFEEAEGRRKKYHDDAAHQGQHEEQAHGSKGAEFDEKKGHKKGHKTKGYHNKYHKDEFHKEHKFYDDYHKGGSHHRYGKFHAKHASNEGGRKRAHRVDAAHDAMHKGTKGFSKKGHLDSDHHGHNSKQGHEEHHAHQEAFGKKGGGQGGSQFAYGKN